MLLILEHHEDDQSNPADHERERLNNLGPDDAANAAEEGVDQPEQSHNQNRLNKAQVGDDLDGDGGDEQPNAAGDQSIGNSYAM